MARPAEVVEDTTPLDGARIDVGRRIGWLLRVTRLAHGMSLGETARLVSAAGPRSSPSRLSLVETGGVRNGQVVDAYEQVLGVETGRLRAAVDVLCRTFPYAPADQAPELARPSDLATFDAAVEPVLTGGAGASEWFTFVREHASGAGYGLPSALMRPLVDTPSTRWGARWAARSCSGTRRCPGCAAGPTPTWWSSRSATWWSTRPPRCSSTR